MPVEKIPLLPSILLPLLEISCYEKMDAVLPAAELYCSKCLLPKYFRKMDGQTERWCRTAHCF